MSEDQWSEVEKADCRRIYAALIFSALLGLAILLSGCAHGPIAAVSLSSEVSQNASIKKNVVTAQQDINEVLKDNAIIARPDLTLDLQNAEGQLIDAQATNATQAVDLANSQKQIVTVTNQGNEAIAAYNATLPKHQRDLYAMVIAWALCSLACIIGPLIFKAYPALVFFPTSLEAVVCSFAAFLICSGVASLLILFGVL